MLLKLIAGAATAALLAGAAYAQDPSTAPATSSPAAAAPAQTDPNASNLPATSSAPAQTSVAGTNAPTAADASGYNVRAPSTDAAIGPQLVTNGPVPDTAENRAKYGQPDSRAGKRTRAAGN